MCVDTSASMRDKIPSVREAIRDLSLSLQARAGQSEVAVLIFPGSASEMVRLVHPFQEELNMDALESLLVARGGTPTGPAIEEAIRQFTAKRSVDEFPDEPWPGHQAASE